MAGKKKTIVFLKHNYDNVTSSMAGKKKTIVFLKHNYDNVTSSLGQLWPGREVTIDESAADQFIKLGYAEEKGAAAKKADDENDDGNVELTEAGLKRLNVESLNELIADLKAKDVKIDLPDDPKKADLIKAILEATKDQE